MRQKQTQRVARDFVASLGKGLAVLTSFDRAHPKLTPSDVARRTDTTPASARRMLVTLHALGYVEHDGKRFWLGPKALLLANAYLVSRPLPTIAQPLLEALAERFGVSAAVLKLVDDEVVVLARATARRSLIVGLSVGSRLPAYCSASGRVLLSALERADGLACVQRMTRTPFTPRTVTDEEAVMAEVDACRSRNHAVCDGELEPDVRSMAVPVINRAGRTVAAMSVAVRTERMTLADMKSSVLPALLRAQQRLRRDLPEE
jgi:IclR family pca regulon transcriptional regulator